MFKQLSAATSILLAFFEPRLLERNPARSALKAASSPVAITHALSPC